MAVVEVVVVEYKVPYLGIVGILLLGHGMNNLVLQHIVENVMKHQYHKQNMQSKGTKDTIQSIDIVGHMDVHYIDEFHDQVQDIVHYHHMGNQELHKLEIEDLFHHHSLDHKGSNHTIQTRKRIHVHYKELFQFYHQGNLQLLDHLVIDIVEIEFFCPGPQRAEQPDHSFHVDQAAQGGPEQKISSTDSPTQSVPP